MIEILAVSEFCKMAGWIGYLLVGLSLVGPVVCGLSWYLKTKWRPKVINGHCYRG